MNTFFGQTFVCLIVMLKNKTRAIEDINISIALVDSWVRPLIGQCKLNDIERLLPRLFSCLCIQVVHLNQI
jgi:hypothetical protein